MNQRAIELDVWEKNRLDNYSTWELGPQPHRSSEWEVSRYVQPIEIKVSISQIRDPSMDKSGVYETEPSW